MTEKEWVLMTEKEFILMTEKECSVLITVRSVLVTMLILA